MPGDLLPMARAQVAVLWLVRLLVLVARVLAVQVVLQQGLQPMAALQVAALQVALRLLVLVVALQVMLRGRQKQCGRAKVTKRTGLDCGSKTLVCGCLPKRMRVSRSCGRKVGNNV